MDRFDDSKPTRESLAVRMMEVGDTRIMAEALGRAETAPDRLATRLPSLLARLLREQRIRGAVFELRDRASGRIEPAAFGLSAFIEPAVLDAFLAAPVPDMSIYFLDRIAKGEEFFLDDAAIAAANANRGLDLVALHYSQTQTDMRDATTLAILSTAIQHFVAAHRGYRLRRLVRVDSDFLASMSAETGLRPLATFSAGELQSVSKVPLAGPRVLLSYEKGGPTPIGSFASVLFEYSAPFIGFSLAEVRILALAVDGIDDPNIARCLEISPHTVRQAWKSILARVEAVAPHALGITIDGKREGGRGKEKRSHLLAYLKLHPSEYRPHKRMRGA